MQLGNAEDDAIEILYYGCRKVTKLQSYKVTKLRDDAIEILYYGCRGCASFQSV